MRKRRRYLYTIKTKYGRIPLCFVLAHSPSEAVEHVSEVYDIPQNEIYAVRTQ